MQDRHKFALLKRLEQVDEFGCTVIRKNELRTWWEQERLTSKIYKELDENWQRINDEIPLLVGDGDGVITLIYGQGLSVTADKEEQWFVPLATWY